jgi:hypothetical protein
MTKFLLFVLVALGIFSLFTYPSSSGLTQPVTLHGTGEGVCINFNGAALPLGFTTIVAAEWTEQ